MIKTVNPEIDAWMRITSDIPGDVPVTLVNLLKFHETAMYPTTTAYSGCTGREAYARYMELIGVLLPHVGGKRTLTAEVLGRVIGPEDESWDEVQITEFPTLDAFSDMMVMPEFQAAAEHRSAALSDSRVIISRTPERSD